MKKKWLALFVLLLLFLTQKAAVCAEDTAEDYADETMQQVLGTVPDSVQRYLEGRDISVGNILELVRAQLGSAAELLAAPLRIFAAMTAVLLLYAVAVHFSSERAGGVSVAVRIAACVSLAAAASAGVTGLLTAAFGALREGRDFLLGFVPVYAGVLVACGGTATASLYSAGVLAAANVVSGAFSAVVRPLTGLMLALSVVSGMTDEGLTSLVDGLRRLVIWIIGLGMTLFTGLVRLQGIVAARTDTVAFRTTRFLVSSSVPIIGASISDALATVSGSLGLIRSTAGLVGIAAVCVLFVPPLVNCLLGSVSLYLASVAGDLLGVPELARAVRSLKGCVDILSALLAFFLVAILLCTAAVMSAGVGT